ncbi:MAG: helix-turn-helix domain-containing protein [Pseudonocardia sp.]|nr:helix-turn-helix domain-containing protein [Pseudonocardia sp.]
MTPELQDLVDDVSRLLDTPAILEDRAFNLVAFGTHAGEVDPVRQRSILQRRSSAQVQEWFERFGIATSERPVRTPADAGLAVVARVCLPARWNGVTYGYLWLLDEDHRLDDAVLERVMPRAARAGAIMARQARTRENLDAHVGELLAGDPESVEAAASEIDRLGAIGRDTPVCAVTLEVDLPEAAVPPLNLWRLPRSVVSALVDQHVLLLAPAAEARDVARAAWDLYAHRLDAADRPRLVAGIGAARADLAQIGGSVREARLAARVAHAVPRLRPVAGWAELGVHRLLACGPCPALRDGVLDAAVEPLFDHPELVATAAAFLDHAGSAVRAAEELRIHRQTLYYRLRRISRLTGLDLADGRDRLTLHLAVTLSPLVRG